MRQVVVVVLCLGLSATAAAQGTSGTTTPPRQSSATMDRASMEREIIAAENRINDAIAKGSLPAFKALVADTAWSLDASGPMASIEFQKNFAQLKLEPGWTITDSKIVWSDTNTAVHFYKWTGKGTFQGQPVPEVVWASTVWNKRQGKWVAVFHQETAPGK